MTLHEDHQMLRGDQGKMQAGWDDPTGPSRGPSARDAMRQQEHQEAYARAVQLSHGIGGVATVDPHWIPQQPTQSLARPASVWLIAVRLGEDTFAKPVRAFLSKAEAEKVLATVYDLGHFDPKSAPVDIIEVPVW